MTPFLHIPNLADPVVLQHLQDTFAAQKHVSLLLFSASGEKLTRPSPFCRVTPELTPVLQPFLDFILNNPPHFADLGLKDGNAVFATFFNGIFHRAILPVTVQRQVLGAIQLMAYHDLESFDIGRWRYILDGFTWNDVSYLAFLDSQPRIPLTELLQSAALFRTQLIEMLEGGYSRYKKQLAGTGSPDRIGSGERTLVTNRMGDILSASSALASMMHYDAEAEMIGLNAIEDLTVDAAIQSDLRSRLAQGELENLVDALVQAKDGLLLRVTWLILLEKDDEEHEVGLRWQVQRCVEASSSGPESAGILPGWHEHGRAARTPDAAARARRTPDEAADQRVPPASTGERTGRAAAKAPPSPPAEKPDAGAEAPEIPAYGSVDPELRESMNDLRYPLFAVDGQNRIVIWNKQLEDLLHISERAVLGLDFSNLLVGDSQKQWHHWIFDFRINRDAAEAKPSGMLFVLDNSGEVYAVRLELSKTDIQDGQIISAIIRSCEKAAPPPAPPWKSAGNGERSPRIDLPHEIAPGSGGSAGALSGLAGLLERQWQPLYDRLTQLVRPIEMTTENRENARKLLLEAESLTRLLQQLHYVAGELQINAAPVPIVRIMRYAANTQERLFSRPTPINWLIADEKLLVQGDTVLLFHAVVYMLDYVRRIKEEGSPLRIRIGAVPCPEGMEGILAAGSTAVLLEADYADRYSPWPAPERWAETADSPGDLGLAAMLAIVQAHGGAVRIVPAEEEKRAIQLFMPPAPRAARPPGESALVLVIDDEPGIVQMNTLMLEHAGYVVLSALSGVEGLRLLQEHCEGIAAVLLDWQLPDITCQEMSAAIARISTAPLILTSGYLPDAEIKAVIEQYKVKFLQKPYTLAQLVHAVAQAIKGE